MKPNIGYISKNNNKEFKKDETVNRSESQIT